MQTKRRGAASGQILQAIPVEVPRCRVLPDGRMTRRDAALYLGFAEKTLAMLALQGRGPRSVKIGGRRFYYKADLDGFKVGKPSPGPISLPDSSSRTELGE